MTRLTTARLVLREVVPGDWRAILAYQSDPAYLRYYPWSTRTPKDVRNFVRMLTGWRRERPRTKFQFAATLRASGDLIGTCGIRRRAPDATEADVGIELAPARWGQGYATEAMKAILRFGFGELKLHRIWAQCITDNRSAVGLVRRLGMKREGRLGETTLIRGRWHDSLIYAVLAREWKRRG